MRLGYLKSSVDPVNDRKVWKTTDFKKASKSLMIFCAQWWTDCENTNPLNGMQTVINLLPARMGKMRSAPVHNKNYTGAFADGHVSSFTREKYQKELHLLDGKGGGRASLCDINTDYGTNYDRQCGVSMFRKNIFIAVLFCCLLGRADDFTVILPENASPQTEFAAQEIKLHLGRNNTVKIQKNTVSDGKVIRLVPDNRMATEEWRITSPNEQEIIISGGSPRGVIYGAYEFLERFAGVIWLDEFSTHIPNQKVQWQSGVRLNGKPAFKWRSIYTYFSGKPSRVEFACRNRQNYFLNEKVTEAMRLRGLTPLYGRPRSCHSVHDYVKSWGKDVPMEYFALTRKHGKRVRSNSPAGPGQICLSHPDVRKKFAETLREFIRKDREEANSSADYPQVYDISANDNYDPCICSDCKANVKRLGNYTALTIDWINEIARSAAKEYPDIKIQFFAYYFTQEPPPAGTRIESNVIVRLAQMGTEFDGKRVMRDSMRPLSAPTNVNALREFNKWASFTRLATWNYWIVFLNRGDLTENTASISEDLKSYLNKADIVFAELQRPLEVSFHALRVWIGYRMMNNVSLDCAVETERFMNVYYGKSAAEMKKLLALIQQKNRQEKSFLCIPAANRTGLNAGFFRKAEELLAQAEGKSGDSPDVLRRIKRERIVFDLARLKNWRLDCDVKPALDAVKKRLLENFSSLAPYYFGSRAAGEIKALEKKLSALRPSNKEHKDFPNRKVIAYYAGTALDGQVLPDSEAPAGYARVLGKNVQHTANPLAGFYDTVNARTTTFPNALKNIPADEKYHWYKIGTVKTSAKCYMFLHRTWRLQKQLDELHGFSPGNRAEIFCRIKFTGPAYVPGSAKENAIWLSEVIALEPVK